MFLELNEETWEFAISRDLRVGPPNTGKSQSLLTNERPTIVISYPGEKGITTFPKNEPDFKVFFWKEDDMTKNKPSTIIKEVESLTLDILAGKKGPFHSFCGDGLHKLYSHFWLREFNFLMQTKSELLGKVKRDGTITTEEDFRLQAYGNENYGASRSFMDYITMVYQSSAKHVTFTCWEGVEMDAPELRSKSPTHIFPDFPGKLAKRIMGEFAIVLYASLTNPDPQGKQRAFWQLRPGGKVWGAGIKMPSSVRDNIPASIEQDWAELWLYLTGQKKLVRKGGSLPSTSQTGRASTLSNTVGVLPPKTTVGPTSINVVKVAQKLEEIRPNPAQGKPATFQNPIAGSSTLPPADPKERSEKLLGGPK